MGLAAHERVKGASRRVQLPGPQPPLPHNSNPAATLPAPPARRDRASARPYARGPDDLHLGPMTCTWALQPARGPDDMRVGPMTCAWAASPRCMFRGSRAYQGVNAQVQGFPCEQHSTTDTTAPKTQTTSPTTPRLSAFFTEVVCTLGTTPPQTVISPSPNGGIARHEAPTRRRHAARGLHVVQTPPPPAWRVPEEPEGLAAVRVGGGT